MPINPAFIGREYPPSEPYEVSREKIRDFALAIGDANLFAALSLPSRRQAATE